VYLYQGRKELVPQMARKAIELAADDKNGLLMLAIYHQWSGEYQQSQVLATRIIKAHPSFFAARVVSAENARLMGDTERSLREQGMVLEQDSRNILSLLLIGLTYLTQGDTAKAREALARARGFEPQNYQVRVLWALLLAVEGQRGEALREMDVELLKYGKMIVVATNVAEFYAVLGDRANALEWLDHAVRVGDERADWFERDPLLASIRTDPAFRQAVEGIYIRRKQLDKPAR
jgi:tetratricopeptide (TPR) repeat protein